MSQSYGLEIENTLNEIKTQVDGINQLREIDIEYIAKTKWIPSHYLIDLI